MQAEALLASALSGDESSFIALLETFEQPVFAYMRWRCVERHEAEDLTQQVFLTLLERGEHFDANVGQLRGFIFGIARRVWLKHAAARGKAASILPDALIDDRCEGPDSEVEREERRALVVRAIDALPETTREVLVLRIHHDLALKDIADAMRIPLNSVKSHLFRARTQLRERIAVELKLSEGW